MEQMNKEEDNNQTPFGLSRGSMVSHYRIIEEIGRAGMGVVYKAQDTKLDRIVALKLLPKHLLCDEKAKTRFTHEAKAVSALDHPNIAKIYEIGEAEDKCFISMVYLKGKSLKEVIKNRAISIRAALEIAIRIGEGLTAAHQKEIIHGNLKSESIMLTKEGGVKIMDFDLSMLRKGPGLIKNGTVLSWIRHISPEQARGEKVDHRTDIFFLGVLLYEMITGQFPFRGENEAAIIHSIINEDPEPLVRYKREVPDQLQKIVDKLLQKDARLRPQTLDEVIADLKRLKLELISKKRLVFRKVRPRYKKALIPALIICFIIAVVMLVILSKYFLKPILEKKGSVPPKHPMRVMCFEEKKTENVLNGLSQKHVVNSDARDFLDLCFRR